MKDDLGTAIFGHHLHTPFKIFQGSMPVVDVELVEVTEKGGADGR